MKRSLIIAVMAAFAGISTISSQQAFNVVKKGITYNFEATADSMLLDDKGNIAIQGAEFAIKDIAKMYVGEIDTDSRTVTIDFDGDTAYVYVAGDIAPYISGSVSGAHVIIDQIDNVSSIGEVTYILSGTSGNGSFTQNGNYKSTIELQGLTLNNPDGAAIEIMNGKRIELSVKKGFTNILSDGKGGDQKAALYCKGHLEIKGQGTLNVTGNNSHAISAKDYITMQKCTLNILGSVKNAIKCTQYFTMNSGMLTVSNAGDDCIVVSYKDSAAHDDEDTGSFTLNDGTLEITDVTATGAKGIKVDNDIVISGGSLIVKTSAPGGWDSEKSKTRPSACLGAEGNVIISGGTIDLTATGGGGKGISCTGTLTFGNADLRILTSGGVLAYDNGVLSQDYTGNTDLLDTESKSSPKGIKADGDVVINNGNIEITTTGKGSEGIESKSKFTFNEGYIKIRSKNDAINSGNTMTINGGVVDVISTTNDGLDSNGDLRISGGLVIALGGPSPECGLDANEKGKYSVYFTGGYIMALGGGNSVPAYSGSTQPFVKVNSSVSAGNKVTISTASGNDIYSFTTPDDFTPNSGRSLVISVPGLAAGSTYTVKSGTNTVTGTAILYSGSK